MPKRTDIIVGCIYRHPDNNTDDFNSNYLRPLLLKLSKESSKKKFLLGDFNIDLLKFSICSSICNFLSELLSSYFMLQIFLPSRIARSTKTLIVFKIICLQIANQVLFQVIPVFCNSYL